jgi:hypothetical protein
MSKEEICLITSTNCRKKGSEPRDIYKWNKTSGYFYLIYNDHGWTNKSFARNTTEKLQKNNQ